MKGLAMLIFLFVSWIDVLVHADFTDSTCNIGITSPSFDIAYGSLISASVDCNVINAATTSQKFWVFITAPQTVQSSILSVSCENGASSCVRPALNVTVSAIDSLTYLPLAKSSFSGEGVIAVFEGTLAASSDIDVNSEFDLFIGSLFVSAESGLLVSASVRRPNDSSVAIGSNSVPVNILGSPTLSRLSFKRTDDFMPIGETDSADFTISQIPSSTGNYPVTLEIYSNYLLNLYLVEVDNSDVLASIVTDNITSPSSIASPCLYDICSASTADVIYKYSFDLSTSCCSESSSHAFEIDFHLWETPNQGDDVYIMHIIRLQTSQVPMLAAMKNVKTFATNPGIVVSKFVTLMSSDPTPEVYGVTLDVQNQSPNTLYGFTLVDDIADMKVLDNGNFYSPFGWSANADNLTTVGGTISTSEASLNFSYDVSLFGEGSSFPSGRQWKQAQVSFFLVSNRRSYNGWLGKEFVITPECPACYTTKEVDIVDTEERYYFVAIGIILCFSAGFLLTLAALFVAIQCFGFSAVVKISPLDEEETLEDRQRRLRRELRKKRRDERQKRHDMRAKRNQKVTKSAVLMKKMKLYFLGSRKAFESALSALASSFDEYVNCTVVQIAAIDDVVKTEKEISCIDIAESIEFDKSCEKHRLEMMQIAIRSLLVRDTELASVDNGSYVSRLYKKIQIDSADVKKKLDEELLLEKTKLVNTLRRKHERLIMKLRLKQLKERKPLNGILKKEPKIERHSIMESLDKQHRRELDDLAHVLQLERFEQLESLRRTKALELRLRMKEFINECLLPSAAENSPGSETSRSEESEESNMNLEIHLESVRNQFMLVTSQVEAALDAYVADVKCLMEEKVFWRRHFVNVKEVATERQRQSLNLIVDQMRRFLDTQISLGRVEESERSSWMLRMKSDILAIKDAMQNEKLDQLAALDVIKSDQYISNRNNYVVHLNEIIKNYDTETTEKLNKREIDCKEFVKQRVGLLNKEQTQELKDQMNFDIECSNEVIQLIAAIFDKVYEALASVSKQYVADLKHKGCELEEATVLVEQFERDKERMKMALEEEIDRIKKQYQKQLVKKVKKWRSQRSDEKEEQEHLRNREQRLIKALVDDRSVGENEDDSEERKRLLAEREKLLASIESSVTMRKLRSQRELEEELLRRSEKKLNKLLKLQEQEFEAREMRKQIETEDMGDAEFVRLVIRERMARSVGSVPKKKMTEMLYRIEENLVREMMLQVKQQEDHMAAYLTAQQLQKSKELALIEEQHDRLVKLKMCLLTEVGHQQSLSSSDDAKNQKLRKEGSTTLTDKLFKDLEERQKRLDNLLNDEKARQNNVLQHKIAKRVEQEKRSTSSMDEFQAELQKDRMVEVARMQIQRKKLEALQQQEQEMISSLVQAAGLNANELLSLLMVLFPEKPGYQLQQMAVELSSVGQTSKENANMTELLPTKTENVGQLEILLRLELHKNQVEEAK